MARKRNETQRNILLNKLGVGTAIATVESKLSSPIPQICHGGTTDEDDVKL